MSTVTDRQPEVVAIDAEIEKTREQERIIAEKSAKIGAKYRADYAKWEADAVAAELAGKDPKPAPTPPDETTRNRIMQRFRAEIDQLIVQRRRAIVSAAETIRAEVEREATEIVAAARAPLTELREAYVSLRSLVASLDEIADARQSLDGYQRTPQRRPPAVDFAALIGAVDHGVGTVLDGRESRDPRTLGVQRSNLNIPPSEAREPAPESTGTTAAIRSVRTSRGAEL